MTEQEIFNAISEIVADRTQKSLLTEPTQLQKM